MKIALMGSGDVSLAKILSQRHRSALSQEGIEVAVVISDQNEFKKRHYFRNTWNVARRQGKAAGCTTVTAYYRLVIWKILAGSLFRSRTKSQSPRWIEAAHVVKVPSLNSRATADAVTAARAAPGPA